MERGGLRELNNSAWLEQGNGENGSEYQTEPAAARPEMPMHIASPVHIYDDSTPAILLQLYHPVLVVVVTALNENPDRCKYSSFASIH